MHDLNTEVTKTQSHRILIYQLSMPVLAGKKQPGKELGLIKF